MHTSRKARVDSSKKKAEIITDLLLSWVYVTWTLRSARSEGIFCDEKRAPEHGLGFQVARTGVGGRKVVVEVVEVDQEINGRFTAGVALQKLNSGAKMRTKDEIKIDRKSSSEVGIRIRFQHVVYKK